MAAFGYALKASKTSILESTKRSCSRNCVNGSNGPSIKVEATFLEAYYVFVKKLFEAFANSNLDYAFTGALAVSFYGVPRTTTDVDVMVSTANEPNLKTKIAFALTEAGLEANVHKIETALTSGYKIATFKCKTAPYTLDIILSNEKLDKKPGQIDSLKTFFQSPEALVAAKLRMIKATLPPERATKDKEDIKAILAFTNLNIEAIKKRAKKDNTLQIFETLTT
jgi:hypothetical protein